MYLQFLIDYLRRNLKNITHTNTLIRFNIQTKKIVQELRSENKKNLPLKQFLWEYRPLVVLWACGPAGYRSRHRTRRVAWSSWDGLAKIVHPAKILNIRIVHSRQDSFPRLAKYIQVLLAPKYPKFWSQQMTGHDCKTLGTSLIYKPLTPPYLSFWKF